MLISPVTIRSFADEMEAVLEKEALDVTLPMVTTLLGAGAGGLAGYKTTREPNKKVRNAILASLLGGGAGYGVGKYMEGSPGLYQTRQNLEKARQAVPEAEKDFLSEADAAMGRSGKPSEYGIDPALAGAAIGAGGGGLIGYGTTDDPRKKMRNALIGGTLGGGLGYGAGRAFRGPSNLSLEELSDRVISRRNAVPAAEKDYAEKLRWLEDRRRYIEDLKANTLGAASNP